jgi:transposase
MREQRAKLSCGSDVAKVMDYMTCSSAGTLGRFRQVPRFLDDGRICLPNNAAERAVLGIALDRKSWLFCGSGRGGRRVAIMYGVIVPARLNDIDP